MVKISLSWRVRLICCLAILWLRSLAEGAEVRFLALETPGNCAVYFSDDRRTALIVDGGQSRKGEQTLRVEGTPLLEWLHGKGCRRLAILCSHPHADHVDGLIKVVGFKATKRGEIDLTHFDQVVFIDSGYPTAKSLPAKFEATHGKEVAKRKMARQNAFAKNAFGAAKLQEMFPNTADLQIANSVYQPMAGRREHGHSIVTLTVATIDKKKVLVVDPDDADDTVVARTTNDPPPPHDVLVVSASHHGSRNSSPTLFMRNGWKPQAVVFQANAANRFEHPHPEAWAAWVKELGVQNVHITGAEVM